MKTALFDGRRFSVLSLGRPFGPDLPACICRLSLNLFPGAMTGKPTIILGVGDFAQAKLWLFVKPYRHAGARSAALRTHRTAQPCKRRKKTQVSLDLGLNPPKEEGGGDTGRSTEPVMAGGAEGDQGIVASFRFRTLARCSCAVVRWNGLYIGISRMQGNLHCEIQNHNVEC